eukprot:TRINITY_DN4587_c0_g1_i2.p1 TRINITY_DN4587_c0_g1~~TRINITY_DN4587_c0_g1_i2.p1  ORF type:complete len:844 (+),score=216.38 TRINITY_DN4587_c0_g1_i2:136-2667(+)
MKGTVDRRKKGLLKGEEPRSFKLTDGQALLLSGTRGQPFIVDIVKVEIDRTKIKESRFLSYVALLHGSNGTTKRTSHSTGFTPIFNESWEFRGHCESALEVGLFLRAGLTSARESLFGSATIDVKETQGTQRKVAMTSAQDVVATLYYRLRRAEDRAALAKLSARRVVTEHSANSGDESRSQSNRGSTDLSVDAYTNPPRFDFERTVASHAKRREFEAGFNDTGPKLGLATLPVAREMVDYGQDNLPTLKMSDIDRLKFDLSEEAMRIRHQELKLQKLSNRLRKKERLLDEERRTLQRGKEELTQKENELLEEKKNMGRQLTAHGAQKSALDERKSGLLSQISTVGESLLLLGAKKSVFHRRIASLSDTLETLYRRRQFMEQTTIQVEERPRPRSLSGEKAPPTVKADIEDIRRKRKEVASLAARVDQLQILERNLRIRREESRTKPRRERTEEPRFGRGEQSNERSPVEGVQSVRLNLNAIVGKAEEVRTAAHTPRLSNSFKNLLSDLPSNGGRRAGIAVRSEDDGPARCVRTPEEFLRAKARKEPKSEVKSLLNIYQRCVTEPNVDGAGDAKIGRSRSIYIKREAETIPSEVLEAQLQRYFRSVMLRDQTNRPKPPTDKDAAAVRSVNIYKLQNTKAKEESNFNFTRQLYIQKHHARTSPSSYGGDQPLPGPQPEGKLRINNSRSSSLSIYNNLVGQQNLTPVNVAKDHGEERPLNQLSFSKGQKSQPHVPSHFLHGDPLAISLQTISSAPRRQNLASPILGQKIPRRRAELAGKAPPKKPEKGNARANPKRGVKETTEAKTENSQDLKSNKQKFRRKRNEMNLLDILHRVGEAVVPAKAK